LKPDFASVLRQWGWAGNLNDLHRAALSAEIADVKVAVGTTMPFMSSREGGRPVRLRNVLWAGKEPAPAYAFQFTSKGRRYRCVTPKARGNFFVEDLGPEPAAVLALDCAAPAEVLAGRPVQVCLTARNTGDAVEPKATVRMAMPRGATVTRSSEGGVPSETQVVWEIPTLAPSAVQQVCAVLAVPEPGLLSFDCTVTGVNAKPVQRPIPATDPRGGINPPLLKRRQEGGARKKPVLNRRSDWWIGVAKLLVSRQARGTPLSVKCVFPRPNVIQQLLRNAQFALADGGSLKLSLRPRTARSDQAAALGITQKAHEIDQLNAARKDALRQKVSSTFGSIPSDTRTASR
jgi:hypothetical protein